MCEGYGCEGLDEEYANNWAFDTVPTVLLTIAFTVLIITGALGNGLVAWLVVRNRKMWTIRNVFIVNLALSDLLLCCFTMPLAFVEIATKSYILGLIVCKLTLALEYASMFVSTFSIVGIVLVSWNLNQEIDMRQVAFRSAVIKIVIIWVGGTALAMPLFIYRTIVTERPCYGINVNYCYPFNWPINPINPFRSYFSYYWHFSMIVQYGLSLMTITIVFLWSKLRAILSNSSSPTTTTITWQQSKLPLLIFLIFCIGWLPLNLFNIATDLNHPATSNFVDSRINYTLCLMAAIVSSCCHLFLYGWLEPSFRAEFKKIFHRLKCSSMCSRLHRSRSSHSLDNSQPNHELMIRLQRKDSENCDQVQDLQVVREL